MENISIAKVKVKKISAGQALTEADDVLAIEEPLEVSLIYGSKENPVQKNISVTMRTPGNDEELAAGFLFTEGIIQMRNQISGISQIQDNKVSVCLYENEMPLLQNTDRNFYTTSGCGVCGKSGIDAIRTVSVFKDLNASEDQISVKTDVFFSLTDELRKQQTIFKSTGGLHASALFELEGNFDLLREDVGRHNALDKVIGYALMNQLLPLDNRILLLSGRASFELIQKAAMAGVKIVVAVGAPSSLAVELAKESGITLIGFLKNERFNIYSGEQRINI